jgi:WD40 repeat protein
LLTASGFRSTVPLEEATQSGIAAIDISILIDRRLIRAEERLGIPHLELTHDLLTRVVQRSRAQRHEREQRELEEQRREKEDRDRGEQEARRIAELRRARRWLLIVAGAAVACLGFALLAFISYRQATQANGAAERNRKAAERSRDDAKTQEGIAKDAQGKAVQNARIAEARQREARARELTSYSLESLAAADPERSIILAMHAVAATLATDGVVVPAAEDALHRAILSSRVRLAMPGYAGSFSPDGKHVVTVDKNGTFTLRSAANGQARFDFESKASDGLPQSMAFSPDAKYFAAAKGTQGAIVWTSADGRQFRTLKGHTGEIINAVFSPDSSRLVTVSTDKTAKLWDIASGEELRTFRGHTDRVTSAAFNRDGSRLATGSPEIAHPITKIWNTASGTELFTVPGFGPAFSPDGKRLATVDNTVKIWDADTGRELLTSVRVFGVDSTFSPDGTRMAATGVNDAKVWDAANTQVLFTLDVPTAEVIRVGFSPDGTRLITSSRDHRVRIWDATGPRELLRWSGSPSAFGWAVFSPDFKRFATAGDQNNTAQLWDTASGRNLRAFAGSAQGRYVGRVVFAPDGTRLAGINNDGTVGLWNTTTGQPLITLRADKEYVMAVAFAPDGKRLATTGIRETAIQVWDTTTGDKLRTLSGNLGHLNNIRFSPDSRRIAAGNAEGTVGLWNVEDGRELLTFKGHASPVYGLAFSPDGQRLATTNEGGRDLTEGPDGTAKIWESSSGRLLLTLRGHSRAVLDVSFSPDGKQLATSGKDATVRIWDALTGQESVILHGQSDTVHYVAFSPDGKRLGAGSEDGTVQVYAMDIHMLLNLARTRVTRTLTADECKRYFQSATCPALP